MNQTKPPSSGTLSVLFDSCWGVSEGLMHAAIFSVTEASRLLAIFHIHIYTGVSPLSVAIDVLRAAQTVREGWMQRIPRMQRLCLCPSWSYQSHLLPTCSLTPVIYL